MDVSQGLEWDAVMDYFVFSTHSNAGSIRERLSKFGIESEVVSKEGLMAV